MTLSSFLHFIRLRYLLPIVAIFLSVRLGVVAPVFEAAGLPDPLTWGHWTLLLLATVLVAFGGAVINDYFDQREDLSTRPGKVVVGRQISRRQAIVIHIGVTSLAFLLALVPAFVYGRLVYALLFPLSAGLLWFYSVLYKHQFLVGNLILALLAFALPFVGIAFEVQAANQVLMPRITLGEISVMGFWGVTSRYALVLALLVLGYTLVRDCWSYLATTALGSSTLPVRVGLRPAKMIVAALLFLLMAGSVLYAVWVRLARPDSGLPWLTMAYVLGLIALPLLVACFSLLSAETKKQLEVASSLILLVVWTVVLLPLARALLFS